MTPADTELLAKAAKAAGLVVTWDGDNPPYPRARTVDGTTNPSWNPLERDGDALRLAVKLGMEVYVDTHPRGCSCTEAQSITFCTPENAARSIVNHDADPYAATRRAIVVAAAALTDKPEHS